MNKIVDLHTHTTISDGNLNPKELINKAKSYSLTSISVTDHDSIGAYTDELIRYAKISEVELIPGIEFSTRESNGNKYHILGLLIDTKSPDLKKITRFLQEERKKEVILICKKLNDLGWNISPTPILNQSSSPTKAHISRELIKQLNNHNKFLNTFGTITPSEGLVTETLLIKNKPAYVVTPGDISPQEAIDYIHKANGLALLAHPSFYIIKGESPDEFLPKFLNLGIDGLEAINIQYDRSKEDAEIEHIKFFTEYCLKNNLVISGGSDFHNDNISTMGKYIDLGFHNHKIEVPYTIVEELKKVHLTKY